jgi:hypothetical protein
MIVQHNTELQTQIHTLENELRHRDSFIASIVEVEKDMDPQAWRDSAMNAFNKVTSLQKRVKELEAQVQAKDETARTDAINWILQLSDEGLRNLLNKHKQKQKRPDNEEESYQLSIDPMILDQSEGPPPINDG